MSYGYTLRIHDLNRNAPSDMLGVRLGRLCIERNIPITKVATDIGVTRQTMYNWFRGASTPEPALTKRVEQYIASLS